MNKILFKYLLFGFLRNILIVFLIFYSFGLILNLFEEIEFFKNLNTPIIIPLTLTALYVPSMFITLLPFIIFVSSMWFLLNLRNNRDLLTLKIYGYSNFKIFLILAFSSFLFGWIILFSINPITATMAKYYEKTKSEYSKDTDHLVSVNKNGLWIKESLESGYRIISAEKMKLKKVNKLLIFNLDKNNNLINKITAESADISSKKWILTTVTINDFLQNINHQENLKEYVIFSNYDYEKITSLFKNFDTISFLDLILDYDKLRDKGYNKSLLDQNLNSMLSLPFFLFIMTALASILTMNTLKKSHNFIFIIVGIITCVAIYFFKDLSLALGQTNRISLSLAAWMPIAVIGLFSSIGILQINEK